MFEYFTDQIGNDNKVFNLHMIEDVITISGNRNVVVKIKTVDTSIESYYYKSVILEDTYMKVRFTNKSNKEEVFIIPYNQILYVKEEIIKE